MILDVANLYFQERIWNILEFLCLLHPYIGWYTMGMFDIFNRSVVHRSACSSKCLECTLLNKHVVLLLFFIRACSSYCLPCRVICLETGSQNKRALWQFDKLMITVPHLGRTAAPHGGGQRQEKTGEEQDGRERG